MGDQTNDPRPRYLTSRRTAAAPPAFPISKPRLSPVADPPWPLNPCDLSAKRNLQRHKRTSDESSVKITCADRIGTTLMIG